jgi:hypothetical protein
MARTTKAKGVRMSAHENEAPCFTLDYGHKQADFLYEVVEILSGGHTIEWHVSEALYGLANGVESLEGDQDTKGQIVKSLRSLGSVMQWLAEPEYRAWIKANLS